MGTKEVMRTVHHLGGNRLKSMVEKRILKIRVSESEKADFLALLEVEVFKAPKDPSFLTDWNSAHGTELTVREGKLVLKRHLLLKSISRLKWPIFWRIYTMFSATLSWRHERMA